MDVASLTAERDLYRKLLDLGENEQLDSFLREALALSMQASAALRGYIELRDDSGKSAGGPWWIAEGFSDADVEATRAAISRGVIAEIELPWRTVA